MSTQISTPITTVANVAVPVADADRALAFYVGILGFVTRRDATFGPGLRWVEVAPSADGTAIALAPPGDGRTGVDSGIRLLTADAAAIHTDLQAARVDVDDLLQMPGVPPMFSFRDPDGNTLYVVENG